MPFFHRPQDEAHPFLLLPTNLGPTNSVPTGYNATHSTGHNATCPTSYNAIVLSNQFGCTPLREEQNRIGYSGHMIRIASATLALVVKNLVILSLLLLSRLSRTHAHSDCRNARILSLLLNLPREWYSSNSISSSKTISTDQDHFNHSGYFDNLLFF